VVQVALEAATKMYSSYYGHHTNTIKSRPNGLVKEAANELALDDYQPAD